MSQRERIIAQAILRERGVKVGWNDLSPELKDQILDEARARIRVADQPNPEYAEDEPDDPKQQALDNYRQHVSRLPSKDWAALQEGFAHGWDQGYARAFHDGWDAAAATAVGAVTTSLADDTRPIPRLDVAVTARGLHRRSMSLIAWDDLAESQQKAYMGQAEALLRGRLND